ncbi:hypothetical protein J1N35_016461 [Gossypium stocksii]|uniref:CASP-like protein n=1 Tax=Gossypium stocksii TaxID=47602 RepID=A0A9D3VKJ0_9ROSI|nr:hypothetical protein J1N35_016461 [Gossypium stocksii]
MESTDKPAAVAATTTTPPSTTVAASKCPFNYSAVDVGLRVVLLAAAVIAVVVMATSKQTEMVPVPGLPTSVRVPFSAEFTDSPAFVYFMAALSTTGLYSIITVLASILLGRKPSYANIILLAFALMDVVFVGIVASATGAAGSVAYIGLRGNSHVRWDKICNVYDEFCRHVGTAIAFSLFAAILLVFLTMFSTFALYKKIR